MKKLLLSFGILFLFSASNLFAQDQVDIDVTATIESALEFVATQPTVEFGNVQSGEEAVVDANPTDSQDSNASSPGRAQIEIQNAFTESISITFEDGILRTTDGDEATFAPAIFVVSGTNDNDRTITSGNIVEANGTGTIVLSVGGTLEAISANNSGSYSTENGDPVVVEFSLNI
jgi:hypothetical protein